MLIHSIIPARCGSKEFPDKNIKLLNGKPLIVHTIEQSLNSRYINKTIVTTDSKKYALIAKKAGASVPFIRPKEISQDLSLDFEFMQHYLHYLKQTGLNYPDLIVQLRPTYPLRTTQLIDDCIELFIKEENWIKYDSLRTVIPFEKSPFKMYILESNNDLLTPLFKEWKNINEPYNMPRQLLPQCYLHNGCVDIVKTSTILNGSISGNKIMPYIMAKNETYDIDTENDFNKMKNLIK